jgi:hypothetical protein
MRKHIFDTIFLFSKGRGDYGIYEKGNIKKRGRRKC